MASVFSVIVVVSVDLKIRHSRSACLSCCHGEFAWRPCPRWVRFSGEADPVLCVRLDSADGRHQGGIFE